MIRDKDNNKRPETEGAECEICFGFNRKSDEQSLADFLEHFSDKQVTQTLIPRLDDGEIIQIVDFLTGLMKNHLSEKEYHQLFLREGN